MQIKVVDGSLVYARDDNENTMCGKRCVDILVMMDLIMRKMVDLKSHLEERGRYRTETKKAFNIADRIVNEVYTSVMSYYKDNHASNFSWNVACMGDVFDEGMDGCIYLQGIDKDMNIIGMCMERICEYRTTCLKYKFVTPLITETARLSTAWNGLKAIGYEHCDLGMILSQKLKMIQK